MPRSTPGPAAEKSVRRLAIVGTAFRVNCNVPGSDGCEAKFLQTPRDYLPQLEAARKAHPAGKPAEAGR